MNSKQLTFIQDKGKGKDAQESEFWQDIFLAYQVVKEYGRPDGSSIQGTKSIWGSDSQLAQLKELQDMKEGKRIDFLRAMV